MPALGGGAEARCFAGRSRTRPPSPRGPGDRGESKPSWARLTIRTWKSAAAVGAFAFNYSLVGRLQKTPLDGEPQILPLLQDESVEVRKSAAIALSKHPRCAVGDGCPTPSPQRHRGSPHRGRRPLLRSVCQGPKSFRAELLRFVKMTFHCVESMPTWSRRLGPTSVPILFRLSRRSGIRMSCCGRRAGVLGPCLGPAAKEAVPRPQTPVEATEAAVPRDADDDDRVCHHVAIGAEPKDSGGKDYRQGCHDRGRTESSSMFMPRVAKGDRLEKAAGLWRRHGNTMVRETIALNVPLP